MSPLICMLLNDNSVKIVLCLVPQTALTHANEVEHTVVALHSVIAPKISVLVYCDFVFVCRGSLVVVIMHILMIKIMMMMMMMQMRMMVITIKAVVIK